MPVMGSYVAAKIGELFLGERAICIGRPPVSEAAAWAGQGFAGWELLKKRQGDGKGTPPLRIPATGNRYFVFTGAGAYW